MGQSEQWCHQHPGADHLRNQVKERNGQRTDGGHQLNTLGIKLGVQRVREGVLTQTFHRLGHHKQGNDPTGKITDGIEESIVPHRGDQSANSEERCGGEIVAGKSNAVHEPVNVSAGGEVALSRFGFAGEIERHAEHKADKGEKNGNRNGVGDIVHYAFSF